jgi:tetratricopeptide (TPR) repeat protein
MNKITNLTLALLFISNIVLAQKLQLTEAATEYKNNFSPQWMMQPDNLAKNKAVLIKAKKAIDESFTKDQETKTLKSKDIAKLYYYRGMIYLDYTMMGAMDVEIMSDLKTMDEKAINEASMGSLKKCMELDTRGSYKPMIEGKINMLRSLMINSGVSMFEQQEYETALGAFAGAVELYDVLSIPDTIAMINAALAAERSDNYSDAYKYYKMCADNNYGVGAEMYQSMIRVITADETSDDSKVLEVLEEGKKKFPKDFILNVEEFNYWFAKGDNQKAQAALQQAVQADPDNKILRFNIGVTFDNMIKSAQKNKDFEQANLFMEKSVEAYKKAIELDENYNDAYYNLGALYYNQSIEVKRIAGEMEDQSNYESEVKRADDMMANAAPYLEKASELSPDDVSTLTVLKSIYFNIEDMDKYNVVKEKLKALGQ